MFDIYGTSPPCHQQVWYDSPQSLPLKYNWLDADFGGFGIWDAEMVAAIKGYVGPTVSTQQQHRFHFPAPFSYISRAVSDISCVFFLSGTLAPRSTGRQRAGTMCQPRHVPRIGTRPRQTVSPCGGLCQTGIRLYSVQH